MSGNYGALRMVVRRYPKSGDPHLDLLKWALLPHWKKLMAVGGLWESFRWTDETVTRSFTIMTTTPNAEMSELHYRIPATGSREATGPLEDFRHFVHTAESSAAMATLSLGVQPMPRIVSVDKKPKVKDRKYLRPDEARRVIEAAGRRGRYPFRDKMLVRMVYRHGLRASEGVGMRWSQVDLDQGVIHIARVKGSNDSTHSLDRDELRDLRKLRQQVTGLNIFETERGGPLSVDALQYIVREAGRAARLDVEVHPHMLRHAAGYTLANEGMDTRLIQDFLGHADIRHTAHYTALSPRRLAAVRVR